jgi:DNA-binding CsgD family transcriptional regulator
MWDRGAVSKTGIVQRLSWPLIGRDEELASASGWLATRAAGGVVVSGEPGVGKTRLASEIAEVATSSGYVVRWVRATGSAASIPLGAFAALLPPLGGAVTGTAELLARARHAVVAGGGGSPMLLCVDDAHLLDDASAALVHQLVVADDLFVVITIRRGEHAPDAVQALWKDELCGLVELRELSRHDVERLLGQVLGAAVDGRSVNLLWEMTRGNALFLRELILYGVERDVLVEGGGIWRWRGDVAVGMRLTELVATRLTGLPPAALGVLELVAVGAPLEVGLLHGAETPPLDVLERWGLIERLNDRRRRYVDVAHPLHGEVIRARLTRTRLEAIEQRLADAVQVQGARRRPDVLRVATWRLQCGGDGDGGLFVRAAEQALARLDWALAERLALAALQAGGFRARLALARACAGAGRAVEAEELLRTLEAEASVDGERLMVAIARASNLFWGLDRTGDADAALRHAEHAISDDALRDELVALRAWLVCSLGRPLDALNAAAALLASEQAREQTRLRAALTVGTALTMRGRSAEAVSVIDAWLPAARRHRDELPLLEGYLLGTRPLALQVAGRLVEATDAAQRAYDFALATRSPEGTSHAAFALGSAWLARGRVRTALRWYRESAGLARDGDTIGFLPWPLAGVAQAAAHAGDSGLARDALAELEVTPARGTRNFEVGLQLTRAWSAAAGGELTRARAQALAAAELAESLGQDAFAVRALHDVARLGGAAPVAERLSRLAERVDGPFARDAAAHADALLRRDAGELLEVADRFAAQDALLLAAEAADAAAVAYREGGREATARSAAQRAAAFLEGCEGARPPSLFDERVVDELTGREREVAVLAAAGLTSRQIADRLVVSIRTVENHLHRTYRKLGISRREDLTRLMTRGSEQIRE